MTDTKTSSSFQSPLARARGLGSSKTGTQAWWVLRLTSIPLIPLFIYFLTQSEYIFTKDRDILLKWIQEPISAIALIIFIICSFYHANLGMQEIIEDYISSKGRKIFALILNKFFFFSLGIAALYAILAISFGKV